ncbi:L-lactate permease [Cryobacterium sp. Hb1]|uniref:L-lactate permease n=1 Tax=Cryobacterium sp. Hb1 TaxID=1259147 RepID=UPI001069842C|nr:L-lactate permease [Cryobacterium sp. Hb1]TFD71620.1 hypothetical protein E3T38_02105 [Cryobacterium sp. Hb1]
MFGAPETRPAARQVWTAIAPYLIIIVIFSIAQVPIVKAWLTAFGSVTFRWPGQNVIDPAGNPVVAQLFKLDHLKAAGTSVLISGAVLMALYKITPRQGLRVYRETLMQLRWISAVRLAGAESALLRKLIGWSLGLLVLMTLLIWLHSTPVLGWMVP